MRPRPDARQEKESLKERALIVETERKIPRNKPPEFELRTRIRANETTENTTENEQLFLKITHGHVFCTECVFASETDSQIRARLRRSLPYSENPTDM